MFITIDLFDHNKLCFIQVFVYVNENVLHMLDDILCFYNIKTFASDNIIDYVQVKTHTKVKSFICVKGRHIRKGGNIIIVCKFGYGYSFDSVVLHIIAINSQITFQILIASFDLIICFRIKNRE